MERGWTGADDKDPPARSIPGKWILRNHCNYRGDYHPSVIVFWERERAHAARPVRVSPRRAIQMA